MNIVVTQSEPRLRLHQYVVLSPIASGGMATVHFGRIVRPGGFRKTVAIKRPHPHLLAEPRFIDMLLDEARLTSRVRHPNVVDIIDVVRTEREVLLVMEYVHGLSLSTLTREVKAKDERIPLAIAVALIHGVLLGLHAAHEVKGPSGATLGLVHRDVSPQNVLVGVDGIPRVVDFGIAKAADRLHVTTDGAIKGKLGYLAPEQLAGEAASRQVDLYAAGVVFWELLAGRPLFTGKTDAETVANLLCGNAARLSEIVPGVPSAIDEVVGRALARVPSLRFGTALEMATALGRSVRPASIEEVSVWVQTNGAGVLARRDAQLAAIDSSAIASIPPPSRGSLPTVRVDVSVPRQAFLTHPSSNVPTLDLLGAKDAVVLDVGSPSRRKLSVRRSWIPIGIASALAAALVGSTHVLLSSRHAAATAMAIPADSVSSVGSIGPTASAPGVAHDPAIEEAPEAANASAKGAAPVAPVPVPTVASPAAVHPKRAAARSDDCAQPFEIDARGIKRYRLKCL